MLHADSLRHARGALVHWRDNPDASSPPTRGFDDAIRAVDALMANGGVIVEAEGDDTGETLDPAAVAALGKLPALLRGAPRGSAADRATADALGAIVTALGEGVDYLIPDPADEAA